MGFLTGHERHALAAVAARLLPSGDDPVRDPGATEVGVVDYVEQLLSAFEHEPPKIWAGGPFSDRAGSDVNHFLDFMPLGRLEELAWRIRLEGSRGQPEREHNGPVRGWQQVYREGLAALGDDFIAAGGAEQDRRLDEHEQFRLLVWQHACEATYGAPEYGGNRGLIGWRDIGFAGDVLPRGWSDDEVAGGGDDGLPA